MSLPPASELLFCDTVCFLNLHIVAFAFIEPALIHIVLQKYCKPHPYIADFL